MVSACYLISSLSNVHQMTQMKLSAWMNAGNKSQPHDPARKLRT